MGAACCIAVRETIPNGSRSEFLHQNICYSPTWSFRWDHRGRVAGEDTTISWFSDANGRIYGLDDKYGSVCTSEDGAPVVCQKPSISGGVARNDCVSLSDHLISRNISVNKNSVQVKEPTKFHAMPYPSPADSLPTTPLTRSLLSSQNHLSSASSTPLRLPHRSSGHRLLRQGSDRSLEGFKSPSNLLMLEERQVSRSWNESARDFHGASSDGWSIPVFSDPMAPCRERWSFDSGSFGINREKIPRCSSKIYIPTVDSQTCVFCSKLLSDKSLWCTQKVFASNDLPVVAILVCGHVYHAECLEQMTPEVNKYDPSCPVCIFGEQQTLKLSEKALKAEMALKRKKLRNGVVASDLDDDTLVFDHLKENGNNGKVLQLGSSSSTKSSFGKPFLQRHFSCGSTGSRMFSDNHPTRKRGFLWAKSSKE